MINLCKKQQGLSTQTVILDTSWLGTHGAVGLKKVGSNKGHDSLNVQYSCVFVGCHLRRKVVEFAVSHETHNPKVGGSNPPPATNLTWSSPETWVTECTGYMGNTFGPKGFSSGSSTRVSIEVSQIIIHKADQPDVVVYFLDADRLAGKDLAEVNLFVAETDAATASDHDGFVVKGIVDVRQSLIGASRGLIDLGGALHVQGLVRTLVVEDVHELIEAGLLLEEVVRGWRMGVAR
jgi:hypothetical protein